MRRVSIPVAVTAAMIMIAAQMMSAAHSASEGSLRAPTVPPTAPPHLKFDDPILPPLAHTAFCLRYRDECRAHMLFRGGPVQLTETRWGDLKEVNQTINGGIIPDETELGLAVESWLIDPKRGDCNDYAVSKRHSLLSRGWPQRTLLLAEVVTVWGKHHLILLVRTKSGDLVLDNLSPQIRPWSLAPYRWIRIQSPGNPKYWNAVVPRRV
jgi:predicted transglutaminase-like cysteine proteinase